MSVFDAAELAAIRAEAEETMTLTATVYGENASSGTYSDVLQSNVPCQLSRVGADNARTAADRSELAATRVLRWPYSITIPETAQLAIGGVRWNPIAGTFAISGEEYGGESRRCDVVRVQVGSF